MNDTSPEPVWDGGQDRFPAIVVRLPGLVLRPFERDDATAVAQACNDLEVQRWLPLPRLYTMEMALSWCTELSHDLRLNGDGLCLAMVTPEGGLIGAVSLKSTDWQSRCSEIGYWTAPQLRGRGYTSRAVAYLARWALESEDVNHQATAR